MLRTGLDTPGVIIRLTRRFFPFIGNLMMVRATRCKGLVERKMIRPNTDVMLVPNIFRAAKMGAGSGVLVRVMITAGVTSPE